jgi:hypothetical protein
MFSIYTYNNRPVTIDIPTHSVPADNGWNYLNQAFMLTKTMRHKSPYDLTGTQEQNFTLTNLRGCARDAEPALNLMAVAIKHPFVCPPIRSFNDRSTSNRSSDSRELERVNAGAADYFAAIGNPGRAMQMRLNGMEVGILVPRGGRAYDDLFGDACVSIAMYRMEPLIPNLDSKQLDSLAKRLDQIALERVPFSEIFIEEGNSDTASFQEFLRNPKFGPTNNGIAGVRALSQVADWDPDLENADRARISMAEANFILQNKSTMLQKNLGWYKAVALESEKPFSGKSRVPVPNVAFTRAAAGVLDFERVGHVATDAQIAVLRAEIAVYRFRAAHQRLPSTLSELFPQFVPTVPIDPFGGRANAPLRYKLKPDGSFLLYSLGPDLIDNGGVPGKHSRSVPGDIVAGKLFNYETILYSGTPSKQ